MEFTGLHQKTTLISFALVPDEGKAFYAELIDYDKSQVNEWIQENVIDKLLFDQPGSEETDEAFLIAGVMITVREALVTYLEQFEKVEIISDVYAYDWVLFCEIFDGAFGVPSNVFYIPFDLATAFKVKGIDPDINREEFAGIVDNTFKHNALHDAEVIQACWNKLNIE